MEKVCYSCTGCSHCYFHKIVMLEEQKVLLQHMYMTFLCKHTCTCYNYCTRHTTAIGRPTCTCIHVSSSLGVQIMATSTKWRSSYYPSLPPSLLPSLPPPPPSGSGSVNPVWLNSLISLGSQKLQSRKFYKRGSAPLPPCGVHLAAMAHVDSPDAE